MATGKNVFNSVQLSQPPMSTFDLSHDVKMSFGMGKLVPTCVMEVLPGDTVRIGVENMLRFAPLISPVMHNIKVNTHYFFVPNRILWSGWEDWITGQSSAEWPHVILTNGDAGATKLGDYLGYLDPGTTGTGVKASVLPIAAYLKIRDEYYRSQDLQPELYVNVTSGNNTAAYEAFINGDPLNRGWMHDYFTAALPFAQKGDAVTLPLTDTQNVPVITNTANNPGKWRIADTDASAPNGPIAQNAGSSILFDEDTNPSVYYDPQGSLEVNVNEEAVTINTLRRAFRLQEYLEKLARGGSRYIEYILSMFGTRSSDKRLQRPEYIGGARQNMVISEVLATATTEVDSDITPVGNLSGHGISVGGSRPFSYTAEEHGYIIGIISVMPETAYQQGLHRSMSRADYLDYAVPVFANIGEQEVKNKEIYLNQSLVNQEATFGYVPRYAEYKYMNSRVHGEFKTNLNYWHLGRIFSSAPALNDAFMKCDPSTRIFAVENGQHIYAQIMNKITAVRKLPKYGTPTI